jgi:hypothetical protein
MTGKFVKIATWFLASDHAPMNIDEHLLAASIHDSICKPQRAVNRLFYSMQGNTMIMSRRVSTLMNCKRLNKRSVFT